MGQSCLCIFRLLWGLRELSFLWERWFVHKDMYVWEQGENCFLLGFASPVLLYVQVTPVCAPSLCAHVCCSLLSFICISRVYVFLCALMYVPMCDADNSVWVYLQSEHKCVCVYMHLFHLLDLMFLLEVWKYVFVVAYHVQLDDIHPTCPCIFFSPSLMNLLLPLPGERSCALRDSLELYYLVPHVWSKLSWHLCTQVHPEASCLEAQGEPNLCYFQGFSETSLESLAFKPGCYASWRKMINWREFREEQQKWWKGWRDLFMRQD